MKFFNLTLIAVAASAALLSGCSASKSAPKSGADSATPLKVMSYNLRYTNKIDTGINKWDARRLPSFKMLREQMADIVGLQEPRKDQREDLFAQMSDIYTFYDPVRDEGVSEKFSGYVPVMWLTSRFDCLDRGCFWLSPTPDVESRPGWGSTDIQPRMCVWVKLLDRKSGKPVYFFNTHLPYKTPDNDARFAATSLIVERMKQIVGEDAPVFVTGDMNTSYAETDKRRRSVQPFFDWMQSARYTAHHVNANPETTYSFNGFGWPKEGKPNPNWNLDHIFFRNITPLDFEVLDSERYGVKYISDHYPITLTLTY